MALLEEIKDLRLWDSSCSNPCLMGLARGRELMLLNLVLASRVTSSGDHSPPAEESPERGRKESLNAVSLPSPCPKSESPGVSAGF